MTTGTAGLSRRRIETGFYRIIRTGCQRWAMTGPKVLLLGPPGAGKGTQSDRIVERFDVEHVSTGDAFRENKDMDISHLDVEYDTPGEFMDRGDLVPDAVVNELVDATLADLDGFVLDGYPRNLQQARHLTASEDLDAVVYLSVPEPELLTRLTGRRVCSECSATYHVEFDPPSEPGSCDACGGDLYQREDDTEAVAKERIQVYEEQTAPVIEFYEDRGVLTRVDGAQSPKAVWGDLETAIANAVES